MQKLQIAVARLPLLLCTSRNVNINNTSINLHLPNSSTGISIYVCMDSSSCVVMLPSMSRTPPNRARAFACSISGLGLRLRAQHNRHLGRRERSLRPGRRGRTRRQHPGRPETRQVANQRHPPRKSDLDYSGQISSCSGGVVKEPGGNWRDELTCHQERS